MAVEEMITKKSLVLSLYQGIDEEGKPVVKRQTYSNAKLDAPADKLHDVAEAIGSISAGTLNEVEAVTTTQLQESN